MKKLTAHIINGARGTNLRIGNKRHRGSVRGKNKIVGLPIVISNTSHALSNTNHVRLTVIALF